MKVATRLLGAVCLLGAVSSANAALLYDGSLNTLPTAQGWNYLATPFSTAVATQVAAGGVTTLDTTGAIGDKAGYFSKFPTFPTLSVGTLDRTTGFTYRVDAQVQTESHISADRSGFSLIAISNDLMGIELGFWNNEIWAQSGPTFTHAEGVAFDTSAMHQYDIAILGTTYTLLVDGTAKLSGPLRNYSTFGLPYNQSNFLFFGDDSSEGMAKVATSRVEILSVAVPEPASLAVLACGTAVMLGKRRRCTPRK